jgi:hypothetical protein
VRFHANSFDPRPVKWPVKHPFWVTGYGGWPRDCGDQPVYAGYAVVVSYADDLDYIRENWPEASHIEVVEECETHMFTERFPKPDWFSEEGLP